jgi:hypothetical protein
MTRLTADRLLRGARRRLARWFDQRLLPPVDVDLVLVVAGNEEQFVRFHQPHPEGCTPFPSSRGGHDA